MMEEHPAVSVHFKRALEYIGLQQVPSAITELESALRIDPKHAPSRRNLALCLESQRRFAQAADELTAWLACAAGDERQYEESVRERLQALKRAAATTPAQPPPAASGAWSKRLADTLIVLAIAGLAGRLVWTQFFRKTSGDGTATSWGAGADEGARLSAGRVARGEGADKDKKMMRPVSVAEVLSRGNLVAAWEGHTNSVYSVSVAPDGRTAVTASADGTLRRWDVTTGRALGTWKRGQDWTKAFAVHSPDGTAVFAAGEGLSLWAADDGRNLAQWKGDGSMACAVAVSPGGVLGLTAGYGDAITLWNLDSTQRLARWYGHPPPLFALAFSPDGRTALSGGSDGTVRRWDVAKGEELASWEGHSAVVNAVAFSPDGQWAFSGANDRTVAKWRVATGAREASWNETGGGVACLAVSPNGKAVLTGTDQGFLSLWRADSGTRLAAWEGHTGVVRAVVFAKDGLTALSGGDDNMVKRWNISEALGALARAPKPAPPTNILVDIPKAARKHLREKAPKAQLEAIKGLRPTRIRASQISHPGQGD